MNPVRFRSLTFSVVILLLAAAVVWVSAPRPPSLSDRVSGDPALATQLHALAPRSGHQALAASVITRDGVTHAAIGQTSPGSGVTLRPDNAIELGSITKTFNGFLLTDAASRGEVGLDDPVGTHLPELHGTALGEVTLAELASHRGGVPSLPPSVLSRSIPWIFAGTNPYATATRVSVLAEAGTMRPSGRGTLQYSNLGATLLGWALASAAGAPDWETHVRERLLAPLGVSAAFAASPEEIPPGTVSGYASNGFEPDPWTSPAFRPAGSSTFVTPDAVSTYARAVLDGEVLGADAMTPRFRVDDATHIGWAWFTTTTADGREVTWHNGGTAGFSTILVMDRAVEKAVFVVGNTDQPVDELGFALLTGDPPPTRDGSFWIWLVPAFTALLVALFLWSAFRARSRLVILGSAGSAVSMLALARPLGSWHQLPAVVWPVLLLGFAVGVLAAPRRWRQVAWHPRRLRIVRWIGTGLSLLLALVAIVLTAPLTPVS